MLKTILIVGYCEVNIPQCSTSYTNAKFLKDMGLGGLDQRVTLQFITSLGDR
jgi:hypothetical protein